MKERIIDQTHAEEVREAVRHAIEISTVMQGNQMTDEQNLVRWSEALAGIARTGLAFTENLYEQERYEGFSMLQLTYGHTFLVQFNRIRR